MLVIEGTENKLEVSPLFILGTFFMALGGLIRYHCYRELGRQFTFAMSLRADHKLVTTGPYSVVRHPGYSGVVLCVSGTVIWHAGSVSCLSAIGFKSRTEYGEGSWARECGPLKTTLGQCIASIWLILVTTITSQLMTRMSKEDKALSEAFGEDWEKWVERVPQRLIPGLY